jgi:hypothetical protein
VGLNNAPTPGPGDVGARRLLASSGFTGAMDGGKNIFNSEYNAFETKITKRFSRGLSMLANYTWGKVMDDQSSLPEAKYQDFLNLRADWSRASYDIKHAFKLGYVYDMPFGRGRSLGGNWNRLTDSVLGGWALEGFVQLQSGRPRNVTTGSDTANTGKYQGRPDVIGDPILPVSERSVDRWFNTAAFRVPQKYTYGTSGAMVLEDDGKTLVDVSVAKNFKVVESQTLQFRTEFFNLPNFINFNGPNTNMSSGTAFGKITGASAARQIQFALRYMF